jgi:hypothetical protein
MTGPTRPLYVPALRIKAGELMGVRELASDIADRIVPRMIVPPSGERDKELETRLFESDTFPDISGSLSAHWAQRDVLVEATHLVNEFGRDRMGLWLPKMFDTARKAQVRAIPLVALGNLLADDVKAYKAALDQNSALRFGLVVSSGDMAGAEPIKQGLGKLEDLGLTPEQCMVIADFHDADLSQPDFVAPVIGGVLDTLQSIANWQQIVFQGTNYPEKNPAEPGCYQMVPRNEWIAWRRAVSFDPQTADHMIFGDYAADCAKLAFGAGGGAAIPHYRYATIDAWLVQRGLANGTHQTNMRKVCQDILGSGKFAGRTFSWADEYIYRTAKEGGGPGNAKDWRAINTTHHITRVVTDIGVVRGVQFRQKTVEPFREQIRLFD